MTSHVTFKQGVKECIPTLLGYVGIGLSFGIVAASQHFSIIEILLLCLLVYLWCTIYYMCACGYWNTDFCHCPYNIDCQFTFLPTFNDVST